MLTPSAATFVGPLTFQALSRHPVETDVLGLLPDQRIGHIVVADTADAIVVAPATARWLGAMADGHRRRRRAPRPVSQPPRRSWSRRPWTATCGRTRRRATTSSGCGASSATASSSRRPGPLASGQSGVGRLAELEAIVDAVVEAVGDSPVRQPDAAARPPLVAASRARPRGPARRRDRGRHRGADRPGPVHRQPSSGKMGVAIAEAAARARRPGDARRRPASRSPLPPARHRRPRRDARPRCATP